MITSISIKNIATFNTDTKPIENLRKVNFFFGYNGTGKSTIAKFLQSISTINEDGPIIFNDCSLKGYDPQKHYILTFNNKFIDLNFIQNKTQNGIFFFNQKNDEIDKEIEKQNIKIMNYEERIKDIENHMNILNKDKKEKYEELLKKCWDIRQHFTSLKYIKLEYSTSKENHFKNIKTIIQRGITSNAIIEQLNEAYQILYLKEINEIPLNINVKNYKNIRNTEKELNKILQEIIIGNEDVEIDELIKILDNRLWVEQGTEYLRKTNNICPFCQKQTIDEELKQQFDKYFDLKYKQKIENLKKILLEYKSSTNSMLTNIKEIESKYNENNCLSDLHHKIVNIINNNTSIINDKLEKPNEKKSIISIYSIKNDLKNIIKLINENNIMFNELDKKRKLLNNNIWEYMANKSIHEIEKNDKRDIKYDNIESISTRLIEKYKIKIQETKKLIRKLQSQTINTTEAVANINTLLRNAGFEGFIIEEIEKTNEISKYYLKRPENPNATDIFNTLSEGEKNFISFLYFHQLCIGTDDLQNNVSKKKIIVIDDPVSSLDSQTLFIVSTLIRTLIQKKDNVKKRNIFKIELIEQFFLFTHNTYFYKEITFKRFICEDISYYLVSKNKNISFVEFRSKLMISDDYELLWDTIKSIKNKLPNDNSLNILISNAMRRIIESYVNFIGIGKSSWDALIKINKKEQDYFIWSAFISILNAESHKVGLYDTIYYQRLANVQPKILFDTFEKLFVEIGNEHYQYMMEKNHENGQLGLFGD